MAELAESFTAALGNRLRSDPPRRKGDRTRERFKLATAQVLENVGFHAMRVSDITDAADASEGTFYIYFRDKRDATRTVLQEFLGGMQDKVDTDLVGAGSAFQAIRETNLQWIRQVRANAGLMRCAFQLGDEDPEFGRLVHSYNRAWYERVAKSVVRHRSKGATSMNAAMFAAYSLGAMMDDLMRRMVVYSVFAVPYLAMPAEMSTNAHERASIMTYRMTFAMAGVLIGSAAAPALVHAFGGGRAGYSGMSLVMGSACGLVMLIAFFGTARAPTVAPEESDFDTGRVLDGLRDRLFRPLALAYLLQLAGLGVFTGIAPYFVRYVLKRQDTDLSSLFLSLLAGTLLSLFGWLQLSKRIGKKSAYLAATVLSVLAFAGLWFTREVEAWPEALALTAFAGVGFGGLQLLPFAMLTDVIHAARGDQRDCAGAFTGLWTAVEKSGLALGPLVIALILQEGGFRSGFKVQGDAAIASIQYAVSLAPAILILASLPALFTYSARSRATEQGEVRRTPGRPSAAAVS